MAALVKDHECCICMVAYTQERPPKLLQCGHSFCAPCLSTWCSDNATCPTCHKPHNLRPATVDSLPTNYGLLGVAQLAKEAARRPQCQQHQKQMKSRCMDCKDDLCLQCLVDAFSTGAHNGHKVVSFNDLAKFLSSEISEYEIKVTKAYEDLLEKNARDVEVFQRDVNILRSEVNTNADDAVHKINQNRKAILFQLDTKTTETLESVQNDIGEINNKLETFKKEISDITTQVTDSNLQSVKEKANAFEEVIRSFESSSYFPKISIAGELSVTLADLSVEVPNPPTIPTLSELSLRLPSPSTQSAPSEDQIEASGQSGDSAASTEAPLTEPPARMLTATPSPLTWNRFAAIFTAFIVVCVGISIKIWLFDAIMYQRYSTHGIFRVRGEPGTVIHLCRRGGSFDNMRRLLEEMEPPPDAVVWGWSSDPPQMPPTTEIIRVSVWWDNAVQGVRQAEESGHKTVAVMPLVDADDLITPLVDQVTSRRQHAADHVIVVLWDQDAMPAWQQQLAADARMTRLS